MPLGSFRLNAISRAIAQASSEGWNITTAVSLGTRWSKSFSVNSQDQTPTDLFFKPDGTKMYMLGNGTDTIYQYSLSTAWDVSTASYDSKSYSVTSFETVPTGLYIRDDGLKFYIIGSNQDRIRQFSMSTAWDISTATSDNLTVLVSGQETAPQGLFFKPDGTKVTIIGSTSDSVRSYNLSTAWNISTATYASEVISVVGRDANPSAIFIKPDGTKFWMLGFNNDTISQYSMSTAWNVSSATFDDQVLNIGAGESIPHGLQFSSDGTKLYVLGQAGRYIRQYNLSTAWDISSSSIPPATGTGYLYVGAQDISSQGIAFNDDGTKMYVIGAGNDRISQYTLSTPWSISSATYANKNFSVTDNETDPSGLYIKPDGTKFWIIGTVGDRIRQYSMNTPWDISTSVYDVITRSVGTTETFPTALFFKPDGTKMYFSGITSDAIQWYNLSTPWDITSGSLDAQNFSIASQGSNIGDMFFKPDGTRFYWVDTTLGTVFEYNLSTAWDIMSASYSRSYDARAVVANPQAFTFKPDGTKMYIGEAPYGFIYEYNIGS